MAKPTSSSLSLLGSIALIVSLFLALSIAQSRILQGEAPGGTLQCVSAYGVKGGDTCFAVEKKFNLAQDFFDAINPNLNCSALFIGQWLCIDGTLS